MKKIIMVLLGLFLIIGICSCDESPVKIGMTKQEVLGLINEYKKRMEVPLYDESMIPKTIENGYETWILYVNVAKSLFITRDDYRPFDALIVPAKFRFYISFDLNDRVIRIVDKTPKTDPTRNDNAK